MGKRRGILSQCRQGHDDLSAGLRVAVSPRAVLRRREEVQRLLHGTLKIRIGMIRTQRLEPALILVIGCQCLERHGADVHTAQVAAAPGVHLIRIVDGPVAVSLLLVDQQVDPRLPGRIAFLVVPIAGGIQGDEGPDGAVVALLRNLIGIALSGIK